MVRKSILSLFAIVALAVPAQAGEITAYDDLTLGIGIPATTTTWGAPGGPSPAGYLKDSATGLDMAVMVRLDGDGAGGLNGGPSAEFPALSAAGIEFGNHIVNVFGNNTMLSYLGKNWYWDLIFTDLDPAKTYDFVTTLDRGNPGYSFRWTKITMVNPDGSATEATVSGETHIAGGGIAIESFNTENGYVAKWTGINPGPDGMFVVHFAPITDADGLGTVDPRVGYGYGPTAFKLTEIPEPATLSLWVLAGLSLIPRRRA